MAGKDLIDSVTLSSKIVRILGKRPPEGFNYELFLDENGEKISKSKGNGLTIEQWLTYGSPESLAFYIYREPKAAKKLSFDVIPKAIDEYYAFLANFPGQEAKEKLGNPVWHIHGGAPPQVNLPVTFQLLLNLVGVAGAGMSDPAEGKRILWGFLGRQVEGASAETHPELDRLVGYAVRYGTDFVVPTLNRRAPSEAEAAGLRDLDAKLAALPADATPETIQNEVYETGKAHGFQLRDWFKALYETLLGSAQGPRMGSFIALYGIAETRALIADALK
jgi:lysyl-tRNA synthetase class 1